MPIDVRCQGCGRRFQAPGKLAGKQVKCPHCSSTIHVGDAGATAKKPAASDGKSPAAPSAEQPDPARAPWYLMTTDDEPLGPMPKAELDRLVAEGRLDAFCRVRPEGGSQWRWVEDVYPDLPLPAEPDASLPGRESRLVPCPDCGDMVSRRASHCPHCGCPVADVVRKEGSAPPPLPSATPAAPGRPAYGVGVTLPSGQPAVDESRRQGRRKKLLVIGGVSAALVAAAAIVAVSWISNSAGRILDTIEPGPLLRDLPIEQPPAQSEPPAGRPAPSDSFEAWAQEASAAMATEIDQQYRKAHLATSLLDRSRQSADLLDTLRELQPGRKPPQKPAPPAKPDTGTEAYESKYDSLYQECLAEIHHNVSADGADRDDVSKAARRWAAGKQAALDKDLENRLEDQLGL